VARCGCECGRARALVAARHAAARHSVLRLVGRRRRRRPERTSEIRELSIVLCRRESASGPRFHPLSIWHGSSPAPQSQPGAAQHVSTNLKPASRAHSNTGRAHTHSACKRSFSTDSCYLRSCQHAAAMAAAAHGFRTWRPPI